MKDTNGNVSQVDNYGCGDYIWDPIDYLPNIFIEPVQQSDHYHFDKETGIVTIHADYEIKEVRVFINGNEKRFQQVPAEQGAAVTNKPKRCTEHIKTKNRSKRRTPSKQEKSFYKKYGERFRKGNTSCRNEILNEILDYQKSHPDSDWRITDRNGIYNCLYNNCARPKK